MSSAVARRRQTDLFPDSASNEQNRPAPANRGREASPSGYGKTDVADMIDQLDKLIAGRVQDIAMLKSIAESLPAASPNPDVHQKLRLLARSSREAFRSLQTSRDMLVSLQRKAPPSAEISLLPDLALPGRRPFETRLDEVFGDSATRSDTVLMLIEIGALNFLVAEAGVKTATKVVRRFGAILRKTVRRKDFVARVSPNRFAIIFRNVLPDDVASIAVRIHNTMENRLTSGHMPVMKMLSVTTGIAGCKAEDTSGKDVLERAEESVSLARRQVGAAIYIA